MRRRRQTGKALALWNDSLRSGFATLQVLAVRVPQLLTGTMSQKEAAKMVTEKGAALHEGAAAASQVAVKPRRGASLQAAFSQGVAMIEAGSRPARRTVKANARRLTGGRRSAAK